jgi:hypothetical protein
VDCDTGVEGLELARVQVEVRGGEVAEVDCFGAVARELVRGGAADAYGGVCAWEELGGAAWWEECDLPVMMTTLSLTLLLNVVSMERGGSDRGSVLTDFPGLQIQSVRLACPQSYLKLGWARRALCSGPSGSPWRWLSA